MPHSRLTRIEEKRTKKQLILVVLGTIVLLLFVIYVGIPLLIGTSAFLGTLKSNQPGEQASDKTAPFPPVLSPVVSATNNPQVTIEGYAEGETTLTLFVNNSQVKEILLGSDGVFSFSDILLTEGENTIYAIATDAADNESPTSTKLKITYKKEAPKLEMNEPQEGQIFSKNQQDIQIKGTTDPGVDIRINDRFVVVKDDGSFTFSLKLNDGENAITIVARDPAGNETKLERKVIYQP